MSITGADSHSDHSPVPELQQATLELEVDVDMMLTYVHQLLDHDNQRLATWHYLLDQNSRWRKVHVHYWLEAGPPRPTHPGALCVPPITSIYTCYILELYFTLMLCYYSQNYSCIITASLMWTQTAQKAMKVSFHQCLSPIVSKLLTRDKSQNLVKASW